MILGTFIVLCLVGYVAWIRMRFAALIFPGTWFAMAWIIALSSYSIMLAADVVPFQNDRLLGRLLLCVVLTALAFMVLCLLFPGRDATVNQASPRLQRRSLPQVLLLFSFVGLAASVINWVAVGAPLAYDENIRQAWLEYGPTTVTARMWWPFLLSYPAAVGAGKFFAARWSVGQPLGLRRGILCLIPLISGAFWMLGVGGRQILGFLVILFIIGTGLGVYEKSRLTNSFKPTNGRLGRGRVRKLLIRLVVLAGLVVMCFALVASVTNKLRSRFLDQKESSLERIPVVNIFGPFVEYMAMTVCTHQAYGQPKGRDWRATGPVSFAGILESIGVRALLGYRRVGRLDTNPERALAHLGFPLAAGTRDIFYDLEDDFGYSNAIIISLIIAAIAHFAFVLSRRLRDMTQFLRLVPLVMFLMYFGYSHQLSLFMHDTLRHLLISFAAWDIAAIAIRRTAGRRIYLQAQR